jgi:lincosamide nucleotidyltransferase A/C/D/E
VTDPEVGLARRSAKRMYGWTATLTQQIVRRTAARRVLELPAARRVADRMKVRVEADEVLSVLALLSAGGSSAWLVGGWGVDALLGEETRRHTDVDISFHDDSGLAVDQALASLTDAGYSRVDDDGAGGAIMPVRILLRNAVGSTIELLPVSSQTITQDDIVAGTVRGQAVPCLSAARQLDVHQGYEPRDQDRHDVALLCERFALPAPAGYE